MMRTPLFLNLGPDDLLGWRMLGCERPLVAETVPSTTLRRGDRGPQVGRLQRLLNEMSRPSPHLKTDDHFGPGTERAVRAFQAARHLPVDGRVDAMTWLALQSSPAPQPAAEPVPLPAQDAILDAVDPADEPAWLAIARGEVGQAEVKGKRKHNQRILDYHATTTYRAKTDEVAWCSSFVNWVMLQAGIEGTNSAGAASWIDWGRECEPVRGAIVIIHNPKAKNTSLSTTGNHVGFLLELTKRHYVMLGGNQGNSVKVSEYRRSSWQLRGYRWPA